MSRCLLQPYTTTLYRAHVVPNSCHDRYISSRTCRSKSLRNGQAQASVASGSNFKEVGLVLSRDDAVADQKVDNDQTAVGLEFTCMQTLEDIGYTHELHVSYCLPETNFE